MLSGLDRPQSIAALTLVATVLFIASGTVGRGQRPLLRRLAVVAYGAAAAVALFWLWRWLGR